MCAAVPKGLWGMSIRLLIQQNMPTADALAGGDGLVGGKLGMQYSGHKVSAAWGRTCAGHEGSPAP